MTIFFGNLIAFIASILMVYSGVIKKKKKILYIQTMQIILSGLSNFVLGGITGVIINILSCIRNILCYHNKLKWKEKIIIVTLALILSLNFNNLGIIGLLPVVSIVIYTLYINIQDVVKFKMLIIFSMLLWFVYDLYINAYVAAIFDFMSIITNIISVININNKKKC